MVGGDGEALGLVAPCDELEEDGALGLILLGVGDVVEDDEVKLVELGERGFEDEVAPRRLQSLHELGRAGVEDAVAGLDQGDGEALGLVAPCDEFEEDGALGVLRTAYLRVSIYLVEVSYRQLYTYPT